MNFSFDADHGRVITLGGKDHPVKPILTRDVIAGGFMEQTLKKLVEADNAKVIDLSIAVVEHYVPSLDREALLDLPSKMVHEMFLYVIGTIQGDDDSKN